MVIFLYNLYIFNAKNVEAKQKHMDYIGKWPFMVIFLYNLYIFMQKVLKPKKNV